MLNTSNPLQNKTRIITRRMFILGAVKITIFFAIVVRLFYHEVHTWENPFCTDDCSWLLFECDNTSSENAGLCHLVNANDVALD